MNHFVELLDGSDVDEVAIISLRTRTFEHPLLYIIATLDDLSDIFRP